MDSVRHSMPRVTVIGLGPGNEDHMAPAAIQAMMQADKVYLRTEKHPCTDKLQALGIDYETFDAYYETAAGHEEVYSSIADTLLTCAKSGIHPVYAVPGHPTVGEDSVRNLVIKGKTEGVAVHVLAAESFLDAVFAALGIDPLDGLTIADGVDMKDICPSTPLLISHIYSPLRASDVKLALLEKYPPDHQITVVKAAGVASQERIENIPLEELDRLPWLDHLTSVYIPRLETARPKCEFPADRIVEIMGRLRGDGGCPWDRQQTLDTLKPYVIEEAYEVVDAIESRDPHKLCDELGDLLLQVAFQCQIARERGDFDFNDVVNAISEKLIRRHPHVFGSVEAKDSKTVLRNWEYIKQQEKKDIDHEISPSLLDGVAKGLPALMHALKIQDKASRVGFDWNTPEEAFVKVSEEAEEVRDALERGERDSVREEIGDLLFAVVNVARLLGIDPEEQLRHTTSKFVKRFRFIESEVRRRGLALGDMTLAEMDSIWDEAKAKGL